jgi:4-carboxymuconolactone decarboxylase
MRGVGGARSGSPLSAKQSELTILINGRFWTTQFEWLVHHRAAVQAGLSEATISAIAEGRRPMSMQPDEEVVYDFFSELLNTKQVSDAVFQAAKDKLGERGIVDMIAVAGFYQTVSLMMNVDRYPLQNNQTPELKPLAKPLPYVAGQPAVASGPSPAAAKSSIPLRGDRFKALAYEEMTTQQKALVDQIQSGKLRGNTDGPLNVLLRSPELGEAILRYGAYVRFDSPLPKKVNELATLITTRYWTSQFPWYAHHRAAAQAGLSEAIIIAIAEGRRPTSLQPDEQAAYNFCAELLRTTQMSDVTFNASKTILGERGLVELMGVLGYYQTVSMLLNIDRYPLPEGAKPELKPLANPLP